MRAVAMEGEEGELVVDRRGSVDCSMGRCSDAVAEVDQWVSELALEGELPGRNLL